MIKKIHHNLGLLLFSFLIVGIFNYALLKHYTRSSSQSDPITKLETALFDLRFNLRGPEKPKAKVGILAIDEKSIQQFGRWPFSRRYYEKALNNLKKAGASWVGFDAVFSESEISSIQDIEPFLGDSAKIQELKQNSPGDTLFSEGIHQFKNLVLGFFYFESKKEIALSGRDKDPFSGLERVNDSAIQNVILPEGKELAHYPDIMKIAGLTSNTPIIDKASDFHAFFANEPDPDAIMRWVTLVKIANDKLLPSLSLKIAAEAMDRDILAIFKDSGIESLELINRKDESDSLKIPLDPLGYGRILLKHRGPSRSFPHISLAAAYNDSFTDEERAFLKESILLLGMTAIGINDQRPNPFDPSLDGVEVHATVVDNILSKDFMKRTPEIFLTEMQILASIGIVFALVVCLASASWSALIMLLFLFGLYFVDQKLWFGQGKWIYIGMPFIEIITLFLTITLYKYFTEERERKKVKGAFSLYLSPDVISEVLENPENLQLGGVRKELTCLFSDVRNFTTISESLSPEKLTTFMNEYFTPMTEIILKSKGVLDKYIGDAIMCFWGAPIPLVNHADCAAESALAMIRSLKEVQKSFEAKGFPHIDIGIGLNTGPMSVGNMGSKERFCYTIMGDAVNLGARLEGLTKDYGVKILVSEFTVANLTPKKFFYRDLDDIRVKGKNKPVKVFELIDPNFLPTKQELETFIKNFEDGRKHYLAKNWGQAQASFESCQSMKSADGPSQLYLSRIEHFQAEGVPADWDGVYTFKHK